MKHWKDMNKFEKIEAIRIFYTHGCFAKDIAAKIKGATAASVVALCKRNRQALSDCPLGARGKAETALGACEPSITADQMAGLIKMRNDGMTLEQMGKALGCSQSSISRAFTRYGASTKPLTRNRVTSSAGQLLPKPQGWKARVSDYIDHPLSRLIHEGPTPEQRALMQEGRI